MDTQYRVHVGYNRRGAKYVYFNSLDAARAFCNEVEARTHIILSIVACDTTSYPMHAELA